MDTSYGSSSGVMGKISRGVIASGWEQYVESEDCGVFEDDSDGEDGNDALFRPDRLIEPDFDT